jgi:hypothetical protein
MKAREPDLDGANTARVCAARRHLNRALSALHPA